MATGMLVVELWTAEAIGTGVTKTTAAIDIAKLGAAAVHVTALTGTTPDVTFTYTLSNSRAGTYVAGEATIKANANSAGIHDFSPEAGRFIKILAKNNSGANIATLTAQLAVQES